MFASAELCRRIECAVAWDLGRAAEHVGGFTVDVGDGLAIFAGADSPLTKVVGLGPEPDALEEVERRFGEHGAAVTVELPTLAEPVVPAALSDRGYKVVGFEDVLGRSTEVEPAPLPEGVELRPSDDDELEAWLDVLVEGFAHPDGQGPQAAESFPRDVVRRAVRAMAATASRILALRDGAPAAAGSLSVHDGVAFLSGAATLPAHRRRGLQSSLLEHRLGLAHGRGAGIACITTAPGSKSKQNAQRRGFSPLYTRVLFSKAV